MKKKDLLDSIEYVDPALIREADVAAGRGTGRVWRRWGALAACLALIGAVGLLAYLRMRPGVETLYEFPHTAAPEGIPAVDSRTPESVSVPTTDPESPEGVSVPTTDPESGTPGEQYALYTDRIQLPEKTDGVEFDMIGCLVYRGSVYTQASTTISDPAAAEQLIGDYVGQAKGTLDEWSSQEEWATEFASTYQGPVYRVRGYSESFRLCIPEEYRLVLLDNCDGIGLNTGADLFEKRLCIPGRVARVWYMTHDDWNNGEHYYVALEQVTDEQFAAFIDCLCASPFEQIVYSENPDFYDEEVQGHLFLEMDDGTQIELRLIEGGYVGYQSLGWFFVRMPGELFDTILQACQ